MDTPNPNASPLVDALARHGDKLDATGVSQLHTLWREDFAGMNPGIVADLVDLRLQRPEYQHFLKAGGAVATPGQGQQGQAATGGRLPVHEQLKANLTAQRSGPAAVCGMNGTYGR